jgi:sugar phosphate isomerase/epimerase
MKLGANSVLFGGHDLEAAFKHIAMAGYDGIELSAIDGMSEHLVLARWQEIAPEIKRLSREYDLGCWYGALPRPARMDRAQVASGGV